MANFTNVSFAGNALQTSNIFVKNIDHFDVPAKSLSLFALAHANKSALAFTNYTVRVIVIEGVIQGSNIADTDSRIDTFKSWFINQDQNLDIDYNGGTRRYIATLDSANSTLKRPGGLLYAEFSFQFICTNPFGMDTSATNLLVVTGRTSNSYNDPCTVGGTAPYQLPIFTYTFSFVQTSTTNLVTNPDFETNTTGWSSGGIGTFTRVTTQHHSGVAAGQMVNAASSPLSVPVAGTYGWELYPLSGLTPGVIYTVSLWLKGNVGGESVSVQSLGSAITTTPLTTSWQQVIFQFVASASTDQIYVFSTTAAATWFLDDVAVNPNSSSTVFIGNSANGQGITVTRIWGINDVLVIDCSKATNTPVTVNGTAVPFTGAFPELPPGSNTLSYNDTFLNRTFNVSVTNQQLYL